MRTVRFRTWALLAAAGVAAALGCPGSSSDLTTPPPSTGSLRIAVNEPPSGSAMIAVTGPNGFATTVTSTTTLSQLAPGEYAVVAPNVTTPNAIYGATITAGSVNVAASDTAARDSVSFALISGILDITVSGLPAGVAPSLVLTGASTDSINATQSAVTLVAGTYQLVGNVVTQGSTTYGSTPYFQTIVVPASLTPVAESVSYSAMTGQVTVAVNTPAGVVPSVHVTGPFGYSQFIASPGVTTYTSLPLGSYLVAADQVATGGHTYVAQLGSTSATLDPGQLSVADTVSYFLLSSIAFTDVTGIRVMLANGGSNRLLTQSVGSMLSWSPDGSRIAFVVNTNSANPQIHVVSTTGAGELDLSGDSSSDREPAWSPDGTRIAFVGHLGGDDQICVMNANGSGRSQLTTGAASNSSPAWSPDGARIAFVTDRDGNNEIYVMNADGSGQADLTNGPASETAPAWSPDGTKLAFVSDRDGAGAPDIWVMNADGSAQTRLTAFNSGSPRWSPDGTKISFVWGGQGGVVNADGSTPIEIATGGAGMAPTWSADGLRIAYTAPVAYWICTRPPNLVMCRFAGSVSEIFTADPNGWNSRRITGGRVNSGSVNEYAPVWQP